MTADGARATLTSRERSRHDRRAARRVPRPLGPASLSERRPAARRGPHRRALARPRDARPSAASGSPPASPRERRSRWPSAPSTRPGSSPASSPEPAILLVAGVVDDVRHLSPLAKLAVQFGAAGIAIAAGLRVELVTNDVLGVVDRALLARRDHERAQPARQHGRPRGDARDRRVPLLRDRRGDGPRERPRARPLALARVRLPRLPPVQPPPRRTAPTSSWATAAARCSGSCSPRSGSRRAGRPPGRRSRRCSCRCSCSRSRSSTRRSSPSGASRSAGP